MPETNDGESLEFYKGLVRKQRKQIELLQKEVELLKKKVKKFVIEKHY